MAGIVIVWAMSAILAVTIFYQAIRQQNPKLYLIVTAIVTASIGVTLISLEFISGGIGLDFALITSIFLLVVNLIIVFVGRGKSLLRVVFTAGSVALNLSVLLLLYLAST